MEKDYTAPDWSNLEQHKLLIESELKAKMDYFDWRDLGINNGWISEPFCDTHDAKFLTDEEEQAWENGEDPCMMVFRIYEDKIDTDGYQQTIFDDEDDI
jgi:hypothetical protein